MRVKRSGLALGLGNARPPGSARFANAQQQQGGSAQLELTDALPHFHNTKLPHFFHSFRSKS